MRVSRPTDLTGLQFGLLTVERFVRYDKDTSVWQCRCECGGDKEVRRDCLIYGRTKSCGCRSGKLARGEASLNRTIDNYRRNATRRGVRFELSRDEFKSITQQACHYCGIPPAQQLPAIRHNGTYQYNGIDRIDNAVGYCKGNCVPCCGACNTAKSDMSYHEFRTWVRRVMLHWGEKS